MANISGSFSIIDWQWVWLVVATFLAGVLNAVAGGGSFLSFPAILGMGMLPIKANATNTVALWPGQLTSVAAYWPDVKRNLRIAWPMGLAGLIGGTAGALMLLHTSQSTFLHIVPWLFLGAAIIFAVSGPVSRWLARLNLARLQDAAAGHVHEPQRVPLFLATIAVCFYIGYFGAGAGFLLIALLSLFGYQDIHAINALKLIANGGANGVAFAIFVANGQVAWRYCVAAMLAAAIGGYTSASLARKVPSSTLRAVVVVLGLGMAAWFFWRQ